MVGGFRDTNISFGGVTLTKPYPASRSQTSLFLVRYSAADTVTWSKVVGLSPEPSSLGINGPSVAVVPCGQVWVGCSYGQEPISAGETAILDSGYTVALVPGNDPVFIVGYDLIRGVIGYAGLASGGDDAAHIACDQTGNVFLSSDSYIPTLVIGPDTVSEAAPSTEIFFLAKYAAIITAPDTIYARRDTAVCADTGITLTAPAGYTAYHWDNGAATSTRTISASGRYFVNCLSSACGSMLSDTFNVTLHLKPAANLGNDTSFCSGNTLTLKSVQPMGYTYLWSTSATADSILVSSSGIYWLKVNDSGCVTIDTVHIDVKPKPVVNLGLGINSCIGAQVALQSSVSYTSPVYLWSTGATTATDTVTGTGTYWLQVTDSGCSGADTVRVVYTASPVAAINGNTILCRGRQLTLSSFQPAGTSYLWSTGSADSFILVSAAGTYWLKVTDGYGCVGADTVDVRQDTLRAGFTIIPDIVCQKDTATFTNVSIGAGINYEWNYGNGASGYAANANYAYPNSGAYTVTLIATDIAGCHDTAFDMIYVDSAGSISISVSDSVICKRTDISFTGNYTSIGNTGVTWYFGVGDSIKNVNPVTYAYDVTGTYTVSVIAYFRACKDTGASRTINIFEAPSVNLGPDTVICAGSAPITLSDRINGQNPLAMWLWSTGQTTTSITITAPGIYYVTAQINGCTTTDSIIVQNDCYLDIPNAFTPNGDGVNDFFFPTQTLTKGLTSFSMDIYNRWGQMIFQTTDLDGRGWDGKFNNVAQPEGVFVYVIDATFQDGQKEHHQGNVTLLR